MSWVIASVVRPLKAERNDLQCSLWTYTEAFKDCCRCLFSAVGILLSYLFHFLILGLQEPFPSTGSISDNLSLSVPDLHTTICLMGIRTKLILFKSICIEYLGVACAWLTEEKYEGQCWWFLLISASIKWEMARQLGRHEERRTVSQIYLHWGCKYFCGRHGSSYDVKMVLTSPGEGTVLLPLKHLYLFNQERLLSSTLAIPSIIWLLIH